MKKIKILSLLFVCLSIFLSACGDDDTPVPVTVKTVLMYLVGDNDISNDIYNNIASVERGLSEVTSPGTFVIYWDGGSRKGEFPVPTLFKYEVDGKGSVSYCLQFWDLSSIKESALSVGILSLRLLRTG